MHTADSIPTFGGTHSADGTADPDFIIRANDFDKNFLLVNLRVITYTHIHACTHTHVYMHASTHGNKQHIAQLFACQSQLQCPQVILYAMNTQSQSKHKTFPHYFFKPS